MWQIVHDGLWDPYHDQHMGMCAEKAATDHQISREEQDSFAVTSYNRVKEAVAAGRFDQEVVPVTLEGKKVRVYTCIHSKYVSLVGMLIEMTIVYQKFGLPIHPFHPLAL